MDVAECLLLLGLGLTLIFAFWLAQLLVLPH